MIWSESDSELFIDQGRYFVPERELQIQTICDLIPALVGPGHIMELCCGEGLLTRALLDRFPSATVHALDGSPKMLQSTERRAGANRSRLKLQRFDLAAPDWRRPPFTVHAVVSSLAVHHLDGDQKQALFRDLAAMIAPGGVFVLADLVAPTSPQGVALAAKAWDQAVKQRALELDGTLEAFDRFQAERWNFYSTPDPDPIDQPSSVLDLMRWQESAGFRPVDLHWMKAGHAIFSALRPDQPGPVPG
jgi:tRNA (cmo5U34)-methyltransferase